MESLGQEAAGQILSLIHILLLPTRAQHAFRFIRHKAQGHFFVALIDPLNKSPDK